MRLLPYFPQLLAVAHALVPSPRSPYASGPQDTDLDLYNLYKYALRNSTMYRRGLGTSADIYFINDWPDAVSFTTSEHRYMSTNPPASIPLAPFSASKKYSIEANAWIPLQSSYKLAMKTASSSESSIHVDIGMAPFKTARTADSKNPEFQAGTILAPAKILAKGRDFDFYFFAGPGTLAPLINSLLDANTAAVSASIKKSPLQAKISSDVEIALKEIANPSLKCTYASVTPMEAGNKNMWNINLIVDITAEAKMNVRFKKVKQDANLKVKDLSILVTAQVDLGQLTSVDSRQATKIGLTVSTFKISIGDIKVDGDILVDIVGRLYPVFAPVLRLPYKLASIINTSENPQILKFLNDGLTSLGTTPIITRRWALKNFVPRNLIKRLLSLSFGFIPKKRSPRKESADMATWMSTPTIQSRKLSDIYIPGTHDSAAYAFYHVLSLIKYPDIAFLWDLEYYLPAPSDGSFNPLTSTPVHLGPVLGGHVMNSIAHIAKAQPKDIGAQLTGGIRHFDLRIYYDATADQFYSQHGLRTRATLAQIIAQTQVFLSKPGTRELVTLVVSHTNLNNDFTLEDGTVITAAEVQAKFVDVIRPLEPWVYMPDSAQGAAKFDFQALKDTTLARITQSGNKVLILTPEFVLPELSVNSEGWQIVPPSGTGLKPRRLYGISTAAALTVGEIVGNVMRGLSGQDEVDMLEEKAKEANARIETAVRTLEGQAGGKLQVVSVDWWEHGAYEQTAAQVVVGLNNI
ncbi:hypothetical protein DRE_04182 [Drechslerella stenobrocha 248]|uniref:Phosphatidylinositol-specific phospholipase C X domain-containing protein n=1 Tax=Drechslerella stenobrocha 248 TaxID=1043628 RepID=W7IC72_9PEZI|nr:hypothetical protein DRE_04182 [Drechslerella stenobrocha 248]